MFGKKRNTEETNKPEEQAQPDFLVQVARAREIMRDNPEIDSAGLAEALGISSKFYAHTIKVYVNAQQEGA
jgi:hypothetical protein